MKKRIVAVLLALVMMLAVFPLTVFAETSGTYDVKLNVAKNESANRLSVSVGVQSADLSLKNMQSVVFAYDSTVLTPVFDGESLECDVQDGWNLLLAKDYSDSSEDYGFIVVQPYTTSETSCESQVTLATVYFDFVDEKTDADITSASIMLANLEQAEAVNASAVVTVTNGSVSQYYLPSEDIQNPTILGIEPSVNWLFDVGVPSLKGSVTLDGDLIYGSTIEAKTENLNVSDTSTLSYEWYRGDSVIDGATSSTYTVATDDIGAVISVKISAEGYSGSISATSDVEVDKQTFNAPYEVELADRAENSLTIADYDSQLVYACVETETEPVEDDFKSYDEGIITGLTLNTAYDLYSKYPETATSHASEISPVATFSTLDHRFSVEYTSDADNHWRVCTNDGCTETTTKEVHNFIEYVDDEFLASPATCESPALYYKSCSTCGIKSTDTFEVREALGHDLTATPAVAATCTTAGNSAYWTCSTCGKYFSDVTGTKSIEKDSWIISALTHNYGDWAKLDDNQHQRICANDASHLEKANHNWGAGVVTTVATCTIDGVRTYTCADCGATKKETIPKSNHNYVNGKCSVCGTVDTSYDGWEYINGNWYLYSLGIILKGWQKVDTYWYYLDPTTGIMQSGWIKDGGSWYYLNPSNDSRMATGWCKVGSYWYYFASSGVMQSGWIKDGGSWYYLNPLNDSRMATGWCKVGSYWYYFASSGVMQSGWIKDGGSWYYLNPLNDSRMATGWLQVSGKWYYFNSSGIMVTGTQRIDGKTHRFNSDGAWVA